MRCLLCIARWVSFATFGVPFFDIEPWTVGGSLVEFSTELMSVSFCEIGKIGLEGGYVCKRCSEIGFCSVISRVVVASSCQCGSRKEGCLNIVHRTEYCATIMTKRGRKAIASSDGLMLRCICPVLAYRL